MIVLLLVLFYVFSPFDLIPEVIFGPIGILDDLGAVLGACLYIGGVVFKLLVDQNNQRVRNN